MCKLDRLRSIRPTSDERTWKTIGIEDDPKSIDYPGLDGRFGWALW
jgi:hypothetical protein